MLPLVLWRPSRKAKAGRSSSHHDLHGDNVLRAAREPWLVIDPKPLAGERGFSLAPIVRAYEFGHSRERVIERLDKLRDCHKINRSVYLVRGRIV